MKNLINPIKNIIRKGRVIIRKEIHVIFLRKNLTHLIINITNAENDIIPINTLIKTRERKYMN